MYPAHIAFRLNIVLSCRYGYRERLLDESANSQQGYKAFFSYYFRTLLLPLLLLPQQCTLTRNSQVTSLTASVKMRLGTIRLIL